MSKPLIAKLLTEHRAARNLTREAVYAATGVGAGTLMFLEQGVGTAYVEDLRRLARFYRVPLIEFLVAARYVTEGEILAWRGRRQRRPLTEAA